MLRDLALRMPPNAGGGLPALAALVQQAWPMTKLSIETQRDPLDIFTKSARDFLDGWFEDDRVKSVFAFDAVVGNYAGVSTPGSAYVPLHHVFGEVNGKLGAWATALAGWGRSPRRWPPPVSTRASRSAVEAPVAKLLVDGGKVAGISCCSRARKLLRRSLQQMSDRLCSTGRWSTSPTCPRTSTSASPDTRPDRAHFG